jgi:hypothetical protein
MKDEHGWETGVSEDARWTFGDIFCMTIILFAILYFGWHWMRTIL